MKEWKKRGLSPLRSEARRWGLSPSYFGRDLGIRGDLGLKGFSEIKESRILRQFLLLSKALTKTLVSMTMFFTDLFAGIFAHFDNILPGNFILFCGRTHFVRNTFYSYCPEFFRKLSLLFLSKLPEHLFHINRYFNGNLRHIVISSLVNYTMSAKNCQENMGKTGGVICRGCLPAWGCKRGLSPLRSEERGQSPSYNL